MPADQSEKTLQPPQQQPMPGVTAKMHPRPDHGETSYRGAGRLGRPFL